MVYFMPCSVVPPSPPLLLSATSTSSRTIALQWVASADDGGTTITGYVVEYRDSAAPTSSAFQSRSFAADVLSTNLDNLLPFINYEVRVRGENIAGVSNPSNTRQSQTHPEGEPHQEGNAGVTCYNPCTCACAKRGKVTSCVCRM